jgi:signal peptidase I
MSDHRRVSTFALPAGVVAIALLLPVAILLGTAFLFGWRFQPIETGSMAPGLPVGGLAVVQPVDPADVQPGSVIVFQDPLDASRLVAHRVTQELPTNPPTWRTKGDANADADPAPIQASAIRGRIAWVIPGVGGVVGALRGLPAVLLLVVLPLTALVASEVMGRRRPPSAASSA